MMPGVLKAVRQGLTCKNEETSLGLRHFQMHTNWSQKHLPGQEGLEGSCLGKPVMMIRGHSLQNRTGL